jgi:hypothetical protein
MLKLSRSLRRGTMTNELPPPLANDVNRRVLAHVKLLSAHSDIVDVLSEAIKPLGDARLFCSDRPNYGFVIAFTNNIIFGLAVGMDTVAFRLDEKMRQRALQTGGIAYQECGDEWVAVVQHRSDSDWPAVDVRFWARKAYAYARETGPLS